MTPAARLAAAAEVLDQILTTRVHAEGALKTWGQTHRFAGSKDRRAIADRVYRCLRARARLTWAMGAETGRALVIGSLALLDGEPLGEIEASFSGEGYAPPPLSDEERARLDQPEGQPPGWVSAGLPSFVADDLKRTYRKAWSDEAKALMQPRAPIDLRVAKGSVEDARAALAEAGLTAEPTPWSARGLRLPSEPPPNIQALDLYKSGVIEIQDEGSQIAAWIAGAEPGMTVVDYCAGGGGKTLAMLTTLFPNPSSSPFSPSSSERKPRSGWRPEDPTANLAQSGEPLGGSVDVGAAGSPGSRSARPEDDGKEIGRLIAFDVDQRRLDNIKPRLARAGAVAELRRLGSDGEGAEDLADAADLVLVDAPCSGSGTWRRRPEDAFRLTKDEVERLHRLQLAILDRAAKLVKPGGRLTYVTCSILGHENEDTASAFEAAHPDFQPVPVTSVLATPNLTPAGRERLAALAGTGHTLRLSPGRTDTDGFFAATYERRS